MEVHVYAHDQCQANLFMGWLVCACNTIFHEVITFFFWQFYVGQIHFGRCIPAPCGAHKCLNTRKKNITINKDFDHRCKGGYILGKTPVSLPITTGYSLPPTWDRFQQNKKGSWIGNDRAKLHELALDPIHSWSTAAALAHQAAFQIGRQFRFPWQPAENGWLEIGLFFRNGQSTTKKPWR